MGSTLGLDSALGRGTSFFFEATFDLQPTQRGTVSFGPSVGHTRVVLPSMMPNEQELADEYRMGRPPLRFLVVDDNAINKQLFERTVSHMFRQQKRVQPIYTFAANGTLSTCFSLLLLSTLFCILKNSPRIVGQEAVDIFTKSLDTSLDSSFTASSLDGIGPASDAFDCVFMDREMPVMDGVEVSSPSLSSPSPSLSPSSSPSPSPSPSPGHETHRGDAEEFKQGVARPGANHWIVGQRRERGGLACRGHELFAWQALLS
jgi:CheY-like chemotaxis protein